MAAQSGASAAQSTNGDEDASRLHIRGIKEMPSGHDQELAIIFSEMRRATNIPREQMAERLGTSDETMDALEGGAVFALPPWPELSRIVIAYAELLRLDSRPLLRRLEAQLSPDHGLAEVPSAKKTPGPVLAPVAAKPAPAAPQAATPMGLPIPPSAASPAARPVSPPPPPPEAKAPSQPSREAQATGVKMQPQYRMESAAPLAPGAEAPRARSSGVLRRVLNWLVLLGFVAALGAGVWYAAQRPQMVWSAVDKLPDPIPRGVRSAWKFMRPLEGVSAGPQITDQDSRKSDKLPRN